MSPNQIISVVIPVYRDGARAVAAAQALGGQKLPSGMSRQVIVVDDGSDDDTGTLLSTTMGPEVEVLTLVSNQGRSAARNAGANQAHGEIIFFMDCDCLPDNDTLLLSHVDALGDSNVASTGHVTGLSLGFWDTYLNEASARREHQHRQGFSSSGSSGNLAVRKTTFQVIGGFDTKYRHYGFEDRDLLLRLAEFGHIAWAEGSGVRHLDALNLPEVSAKMIEAGQYTSRLFLERHPESYRALGYAQSSGHCYQGFLVPWKLSCIALGYHIQRRGC
jgi:glycosyltransferase involved in cell wall biosynthesis